jgi:tetratricopeptide (TPR) repeat protein
MKAIAKLKDDARRYEQDDEWEKAIHCYLQVLRVADEGEGDVELPLYNRIGDLYVRLDRAQEAVSYYEQAADRYADAGLFNNAIALCNKALRYRPEHVGLYRKLGRFSASQGFLSDARRYFIDFAEWNFRTGRAEEAFGALEELARTSDDAELWELLGRRLLEAGHTRRGLKELQRALALRVHAGETELAEALRAEIRTLDAGAASEVGGNEIPAFDDGSSDTLSSGGAGLEPLPGYDFEDDGYSGTAATQVPGPLDGFESTALDGVAEAADIATYEVIDLESVPSTDEIQDSMDDAELVDGFESTSLDFAAAAAALDGTESDLELERDQPAGWPSPDDDAPAAHEIHQEDTAAAWTAGDDPDLPDEDGSSDRLPTLHDEESTLHDEASILDNGGSTPDDAKSMLESLPTLDDAPMPDEAPMPDDLPMLEDDRAVADTQSAAAPTGNPGVDSFIDLAALLADDTEDTTRFRVQEATPTGDEDHDFAELLSQFKAKLSAHLAPEDAASHYDLGLAFKEMGLVDEAIAEFQIALRNGHMRLKVFEELGQCFLQKSQYTIAEKILRRALDMRHDDELELLGVYYYLGCSYEALDRPEQARDAYERVLAMDINFRDAAERLARFDTNEDGR